MSDNLRSLLLASASQVRARLLEEAGLDFDVCVAPVDEAEVKDGFAGDADALALELARRKACAVSQDTPDVLVVGADQVLSCEGKTFDKPRDMNEAEKNLKFFRAKTHTLHSAVALALNDEVIWSTGGTADLTMRDFSDDFLKHYLRHAGERILKSVGCYQLEGIGVQLFEKIDGAYFTILGLPLLPLLAELRSRKVIPA